MYEIGISKNLIQRAWQLLAFRKLNLDPLFTMENDYLLELVICYDQRSDSEGMGVRVTVEEAQTGMLDLIQCNFSGPQSFNFKLLAYSCFLTNYNF